MKISKFPEGFFSEPRNIISSDEALKDVVKINWENILKEIYIIKKITRK